MSTWANRYRPKKFSDVVGQTSEVEVLKKLLEKGWQPPALLFEGPYGTGKTSLARLMARALLCESRQGVEPCGECRSCKAMDQGSHIAYSEVDAASQGLIADVKQMKDHLSYSTPGYKLKVVTYDECHMLSAPAQNALLQVLEEGNSSVLFMFSTTESTKVLPTIKSRCVVLNMRILTVGEITQRLKDVCSSEGVDAEEKALRIVASYVRGHLRNAMMELEQLSKMQKTITEDLVRTHLRLDKRIELYKFLIETDRKKAVELAEELLCTYAVSDLVELLGEVLLDAYKVHYGVNNYAQVDYAWLQKVWDAHGSSALQKAERILTAPTNVASITYGVTLMMDAIHEGMAVEARLAEAPVQSTAPGAQFRKPGK